MKFAYETGNERLIQRLEQAIRDGHISHAYVFEGPDNLDKKAFADAFVKGVLCPDGRGENCGKCSICDKVDHGNHEDLYYLQKDGASVKDEAISELQEKLKIKPYGDRNVAVIEDADTMTLRAQNRLLKTLEEPPGNAMILLLSENMNNLTATILSRCVKMRISAMEKTAEQEIADSAEKIAAMSLAHAAFYEMNREINSILNDHDLISSFLDELQVVYRNYIIDNNEAVPLHRFEDIEERIHSVEKARERLRRNVSAKYALRSMLLELIQ